MLLHNLTRRVLSIMDDKMIISPENEHQLNGVLISHIFPYTLTSCSISKSLNKCGL